MCFFHKLAVRYWSSGAGDGGLGLLFTQGPSSPQNVWELVAPQAQLVDPMGYSSNEHQEVSREVFKCLFCGAEIDDLMRVSE